MIATILDDYSGTCPSKGFWSNLKIASFGWHSG